MNGYGVASESDIGQNLIARGLNVARIICIGLVTVVELQAIGSRQERKRGVPLSEPDLAEGTYPAIFIRAPISKPRLY